MQATYVIGTAGHVDHGKSQLVQALTGIDPDRLREEKERRMTIDLGFAWLTLPNGESVGIVDVPGHRDFIENMLAGVGAIDAALFVVAADEGVMPQTREHLAILDLLEIDNGVIAVTKTDLVESEEWLDLVLADVLETVEGTVLEEAPLIPVSAHTGHGLDDLIDTLQETLSRTNVHPDRGRPRLPIDRVFTVSGFGTVVTGTLVDGTLRVGQEVEIQPQGLEARIRGLQTHKEDIEEASPGSRVAINLSGVDKEDLARGDVVTRPGWLEPTNWVDVELRYLSSAERPLRHNTHLKFFSGAAETLARVRLLGTDALWPGETGWVQLELQDPVALVKEDRFIVRVPSPPATVGGGIVVDPQPPRKHRRFQDGVVESLEALAHGTPEDILLELLEQTGPARAQSLIATSGLDEEQAQRALGVLIDAQEILPLDRRERPTTQRLIVTHSWWDERIGQLRQTLSEYHRIHPLRSGMGREGLRSALHLDPETFDALMERAAAEGIVMQERATVRLPSHRVELSEEQLRDVGVADADRAADGDDSRT